MPNQFMQNYLEDFTVEGFDTLSPFLQDAFSRTAPLLWILLKKS